MDVRWWTEPCLRMGCGLSGRQGRQGPEVIRGTGARLQPKNVPLFIGIRVVGSQESTKRKEWE